MLEYFQGQKVIFIESMNVNEFTRCDVYHFRNDSSKDLGIISIKKGGYTPKQKVLLGEKTIEGFISGEGAFFMESCGNEETHKISSKSIKKEFEVNIGTTMQWRSNPDSELIVYEICFPPYKDGRFQNL